MARVGTRVVEQIGRLLRENEGLPSSIGKMSEAAGIMLPQIAGANILERHLSPEIAEKIAGANYPSIYVYCDRLSNKHTEKFRTFSGIADLHIDVRVSADHVDSLLGTLQHYTDAITDVLDRNRGSWGQGMYYSGGYEVAFQPIKRGGRCFLQTAQVRTQVTISVD